MGEVTNALSLRLDPEPTASAHARRAIGRLDDVDVATLETVRLLVSELITNSYKHAGLRRDDAIELTVRCLPDRLHVEVADPGRGFISRRTRGDPPRFSERGWGLRLVEKLSDAWGVFTNHRTVVWFDVRRSAVPAAN